MNPYIVGKRTNISIKWLQYIFGATLRRVRHKDCFNSLGWSQSGHAMLSPFFQPRYSTVLNEKSNNLLPTFSRCAAVNYYTLYSAREMEIY